MIIKTFKTKSERPKKWTRKGQCPSCFVSTGSIHKKNCALIYKQYNIVKKNKLLYYFETPLPYFLGFLLITLYLLLSVLNML